MPVITERLVDFTSKPVPVGADILYLGDSANGFDERQTTISQLLSNSGVVLLAANNLSDVGNAGTSRTNLGLGTMATQAASSYLPVAGGTMLAALILSTSSPGTSLEAASKGYVDSVVSQAISVFVAHLGTTVNLAYTYSNGSSGVGATLTASAPGTVTLDGATVLLGRKYLFKNQSSTFQNGYYTCTNDGSVTAAVFTRSTDYDQASEINPGDLMVITAGSTLANTTWVETAIVVTMGTDPITFSQFSSALPVPVTSGGTGLTSTTANQLLYSSSTNVIGGLASANSGYLKTSGAGVPSISPLSGLGTDASLVKVLKIQTFTSTGTYTPDSNMVYCQAASVGGGGSGGGIAAVSSIQSAGAGGGGGGAGVVGAVFSRATILGGGTAASVTIGAGGTAPTAGNNNGNQGGSTTLIANSGAGSTLFTATGGFGGNGSPLETLAFITPGGAGGNNSSTTSGVVVGGNAGSNGFSNGATSWLGGQGGGSMWGGGGTLSQSGAGQAALANSGGGGGGAGANNAAAAAGAAGAAGKVLIIEYCTA